MTEIKRLSLNLVKQQSRGRPFLLFYNPSVLFCNSLWNQLSKITRSPILVPPSERPPPAGWLRALVRSARRAGLRSACTARPRPTCTRCSRWRPTGAHAGGGALLHRLLAAPAAGPRSSSAASLHAAASAAAASAYCARPLYSQVLQMFLVVGCRLLFGASQNTANPRFSSATPHAVVRLGTDD